MSLSIFQWFCPFFPTLFCYRRDILFGNPMPMDKHIDALIAGEHTRQQHELEMIASENYVSQAVMDAYANLFTNKYSEGYPGKRYYGGQAWVDRLERLCQWRALKMFGLISADESDTTTEEGYTQLQQDLKDANWACNVQPLSGSPANLAVYLRCLQPGDTILGMDLGAGGHLTHGHPLNASGVYYNIVAYGVTKGTDLIDYDDVLAKALEHKPSLILAGFSAYSRRIERSKFADICTKVEEMHGYRPLLMVDMAHVA
jgi:glycine hydroxymethyltransferase